MRLHDFLKIALFILETLKKARKVISPLTCLATLMLSLAAFSSIRAAFSFTGVAAGDASSTEAVFWTRGLDPLLPAKSVINLQIATDPNFTTDFIELSTGTSSSSDYTAKMDVGDLTPDTTYYYRWVEPNSSKVSITGKVKTAPESNAASPLHFGFSGDELGSMRPYSLASRIVSQNLDFYINLGDTIYETGSQVLGNIGLEYLISPTTTDTGTIPVPSSNGATSTQLLSQYSAKYLQQFLPVNIGGQNGLSPLYAAQGCYTLYDNHDLGDRQYVSGGAPAGGPVGDMANGAGVDARNSNFDVNSTGTFINKTPGFGYLLKTYLDYQPIADRFRIYSPSDPRTHGTQRLYFSQQWGRNALFINVDDRSYRDIRMKTTNNTDETGARGDNPARTILGATQLVWLERTLLAAQKSGVVWKFVAISTPIDQIGPLGGSLSLTNLPFFGKDSTYLPYNFEGGKSWMGQYRSERNILLKFITDNRILNVVFLSTDDHQVRINEVCYSRTGKTGVQSSYAKVPYCFSIVCGPIGAMGPDAITNHSFEMTRQLAASFYNAQVKAGIQPIGLMGYPRLHDVFREGDPTAASKPQTMDFYSADTYNFCVMDVDPDGVTLTTKILGINSTAQNSASEYDPVGNPLRKILSFQIDAPRKSLSR